MIFLYLLISFFSSTIGAISGVGGGVIIKPVLDAAGTMSVSTISFLSGCTVLTMAVVSLLRQRGSGIKLDVRRTTSLALGASLGGILGKYIFDIAEGLIDENILGGIQAILLLIMVVFVLIFILKKSSIKMHDIKSLFISFVVGMGLGLISAFLGIGGGPLNIAVLYFFFAMGPKEAAFNSIYLIMFSQLTSLITSIVTGSIPEFSPVALLLLMAGGVCGAFLGSAISKRLKNSTVELCFNGLMILLIAINSYNIVQFFLT